MLRFVVQRGYTMDSNRKATAIAFALSSSFAIAVARMENYFFCANISIWFDCRGKMSSNHTRYYVYSDIHDALSPVNCHNSIIQIGQQRNLNNIMRGCCVCLLCFETATAAAAASCPKIKLTPRVNAQLSRILKLSPPLLSSLLYSADQKGRRRRDPVMKYCNNSYFEGLRFNLPLSPYPQPGQSHPG